MGERTRIDVAFEQALEQDAATQSAFLAELRASAPEVAEVVEELLRAHELSGGILDDAHIEPVDRRIGSYRVLRELGRGGMGVVYLAERDDGQFRRRVAVKLLRGSPDAEELHDRFVAERQILALLDHPNIAQLIDAGATDGRLPYLVMEYVEGLPITQYCERHRLTISERLRLFQDVCAAVHHAHRNLVIHRDLKPGNILVTQSGQVKLLDFGIAKLLNPGVSAVAAPVTWASHRMLTPEYASPEQLRGEPLSTTSDVYALGVVLYELLTGRRPHEAGAGAPIDLVARICEEEPPRPSAVSAARELRGDVEAIVIMALRKEPSRRYGSADLLAQDIQRYLDGLPVLAHKGSRWYYVQKFVRRHRITVTAVALLIASLLTGAVVVLQQSATARSERDRAQRALSEAEEMTAFLVSMFEANEPEREQGHEPTARDLLRRGLQRTEALRDQPYAQARLLHVIGRVYSSLGDYSQARTLLERALALREAQLGPDHQEVAQTLTDLAEALRFLAQYDAAEDAAQRALDIRVRTLGPDDPAVATALLQVAMMVGYHGDMMRAIELTRQAISIRESAFGPNHPEIAEALIHYTNRLARRGAYEEAEAAARRAIAIHRRIGTDSARLAYALSSLAYVLENRPGRERETETLLRQSVAIRRATLGAYHPDAVAALGDLVFFLTGRNRAAEALPLAREQLEASRRVYGPDSHANVYALNAYKDALHGAGRLSEAIDVARDVVELTRRTRDDEHPAMSGVLINLALLLSEDGQHADAEQLVRRSLEIGIKTASERAHPVPPLAHLPLSIVLMRAGRYGEAEQSLLQAIRALDAIGMLSQHKDYQLALRTAVELYTALGRPAEAEKYRRLLTS